MLVWKLYVCMETICFHRNYMLYGNYVFMERIFMNGIFVFMKTRCFYENYMS